MIRGRYALARSSSTTSRSTRLAAAVVFTAAYCLSCEGNATPSAPTSDPVAQLVLDMTIGADASDGEEYQFAWISSIQVDLAGTVWVVDGQSPPSLPGSPLIRQYAQTGDFIRRVGREGSGPGEYVDPYALALLSDGRMALRDSRFPGRITIYTEDGQLDSTWNLGATLNWPRNAAHGIEVDTSGVVWLPFRSGRPSPDESWQMLRVRPDGSVLDTIPSPPVPHVKNEQIVVTRTLPGGGMSRRGVSVPYQPAGFWTWNPEGGFAIARGDGYRIELLPPPARPDHRSIRPESKARVVARDIAPVPVTGAEQSDVRQAVAHELDSIDARGIEIPAIPVAKPLIRGIRFSEDGYLLVSVSTPSENVDGQWIESVAYDVFDPAGRFMGKLALPDSFWPYWLTRDRILGVFRDEDNVETIRGYRVVWP